MLWNRKITTFVKKVYWAKVPIVPFFPYFARLYWANRKDIRESSSLQAINDKSIRQSSRIELVTFCTPYQSLRSNRSTRLNDVLVLLIFLKIYYLVWKPKICVDSWRSRCSQTSHRKHLCGTPRPYLRYQQVCGSQVAWEERPAEHAARGDRSKNVFQSGRRSLR